MLRQHDRGRVGPAWIVEGGALVAAVGAAAAGVDPLHVLQLVLPAVGPVGLPGQVVLGLCPASCATR